MIQLNDMSAKDKAMVIDLVNRLPEDATLRDIAREIEFVAGVREGFEQLDRGEGVPVEEVEQRLKSWTTR
jgi:predicted transcriptional regulator